MITEIRYADGRYFIWADGHCVGAASTQHEADVLLSTIQEAEASWAMGGMSNVGQPMLRCGLPNPLYRVQQVGNICQSCGHVSLTWFCPTCDDGGPGGIDLYAAAFEEDGNDWADAAWESDYGSYNGKVPSDFVRADDPPVDIPDEYPDPTPSGPEPPEWNRPLLAQCAEVIRACLGGPVATSGIVDELRRVERALAEAGW